MATATSLATTVGLKVIWSIWGCSCVPSRRGNPKPQTRRLHSPLCSTGILTLSWATHNRRVDDFCPPAETAKMLPSLIRNDPKISMIELILTSSDMYLIRQHLLRACGFEFWKEIGFFCRHSELVPECVHAALAVASLYLYICGFIWRCWGISPNQSITTSFRIMTSGDFLFLGSSFAGVGASYNFLRISNARDDSTVGGQWMSRGGASN